MSAARRKKAGGAWLFFWLFFFIGVTLLFMMNLESIKGTLRETRVLERLFKGGENEPDEAGDLEHQIEALAHTAERAESGFAGDPNFAEGRSLEDALLGGFGQAGDTDNAVQGADEKKVERSVYLMRVDSAGTILWASVKRDMPASSSPLIDTLEALIKGPSAAEEKQGLISLIPKNVKLQNAAVRGNTAYISFSEDFLFNTYGAEGYAGQRRQIVLTATEFSNVKDVQILIDGEKVNYLGENVWIGSPVSRSML